MTALIVILIIIALLVLAALYDLFQRKHAILRNFPLIGHLRFWLEKIGPELRQYIVKSDTEERPFNRNQRSWIYESAKKLNNYYGFGTELDLEMRPNSVIIKHAIFTADEPEPGAIGTAPMFEVPSAKVFGQTHGRRKAFRPRSIINVSAMSFGALSGPAVEALNRGVAIAGALQNTGEGGLTPHHQNGGDLIFQIGTGYFGVRTKDGKFDMAKLSDLVAKNPVRAIEIKLGQGAKPGHGGVLPAAKVTPQIAAWRGVEAGKDCISPPSHSAFSNVDEMLEFIEKIADETGLPVGIKSAVGEETFWHRLVRRMERENIGPDFVTVDGGEGGTGASPLVFTNNVALPFKLAMCRVYRIFAEAGINEDVAFIGSGKLGFPEQTILAMSLGCDTVNIAREAMLAIGCIQSQKCHTNRCPTGVATQDKWLIRGLDPTSKSARLANYVVMLRRELLEVSRACGVRHPAYITPSHVEIVDERFKAIPVGKLFGYEEGWGVPSHADLEALTAYLDGSTHQLAPA